MSEVLEQSENNPNETVVNNTITTIEADTSGETSASNTDEASQSVTEEEMVYEELSTEVTTSESIEIISDQQLTNEIETTIIESETNISESKTDNNEPQTTINEPESLNESQNNETTSEIPVSKVKSRELKSLLDAAKESNLDTNIAYKRESRKSEAFGVAVNNISKRRHSSSSNDSHQSSGKRNMRSQNPEFVQKHRKFLKTVTGQNSEDSELESIYDNIDIKDEMNYKSSGRKTPQRPINSIIKTPKRKNDSINSNSEEKKNKKFINIEGLIFKKEKDKFCWRCHRDGIQIQCETCPRSYHLKCLKQGVTNPEHWPCPECLAIIRAESTKTRSIAMKEMTQENLCELLKFALKRMMQCPGSEPFIHPVDIKSFPDYRTYVIQPMDLTTLQNNIRDNIYGSTVAFTADAKWILHNSIIFNSHQSKLTTAAKSIIKVCKQEMNEIETCTECYLNANTKKNSWFVEVCTKPHILLWAKLRGFPYWPAKGMVANGGVIDVRFFGAHDRAWVPVKECFLYSKKDPNTTNKHKRSIIAECIKEVDVHIEKLKNRYGEFKFAPYRTLYDPNSELEQLQMILPKYKPSDKILYKFPQKIFNDDDENEKPKKIKRSKSSSVESEISDDETSSLKNDDIKKTPSKNSSMQDLSDTSDEAENSLLIPTKKSSQHTNSKIDKSTLKCITISDFDKFMEGYGTEDDEFNSELNTEVRKNFTDYASDTDDELNSSMEKNMKNGDDDDADKSSVSSSETSVVNRGMVRTRGGYHNVSGKIKVLGRRSVEYEIGAKRSLEASPEPPSKFARKENDTLSPNNTIKLGELEKVNKIAEFPENLELTIGNKFKEVMQNAKKPTTKKDTHYKDKTEDNEKNGTQTNDKQNKKEYKTSQNNKTESIADKLIKRMSLSHDNESDKVEIVKKQILDKLEASSSNVSDKNESENAKTQENQDLHKKNSTNINELKNKTETETKLVAADSQNNLSSSDDDSDADNYLHLTRVKKCFTSTPKPNEKNSATDSEKHDEDVETSITISKISGRKLSLPTFKTTIDEHERQKLLNRRKIVKKVTDNYNSSSDCLSTDEEETSITTMQKKSSGSFLKLVNVGDIISGKTNSSAKNENSNSNHKKIENKPETKITHEITEDVIEIKSEPLSDHENCEMIERRVPSNKVSVNSVNENQKNKIEEKTSENKFRIVDNLTKIIDSVATNSISKTDINIKPLSKLLSPKQKARKTFPATFVAKPIQTIQVKKFLQEKKDPPPPSNTQTNLNTTPKSQPNQIPAPTKSILVTQGPPPLVSNTTSTITKPTENLLYLNKPQSIQNPIVLPPNQPLSLAQNVGNSILAMVQQGTLNNTGLIIQHPSNPAPIPVTTQSAICNVTGSVETVSSTDTNSSFANTIDLSEDLSRVIGDLMCNKPPPKLKPKPPGPLSTHFDEGNPSSAGPISKTINSVSHRLADYFRGLLVETLSDLTNINSPEAKIRSLELEIENLKHKHTEEMLEFRKNISTILKEIQKSIVEEKSKIIDETRAACEAERLRSVEEAKSKQWCAYCLKEAQFYCCWNTSYCDYPCQQQHWATHMKTCSQSTVKNNSTGTVNTPNKTIVPQAAFKTVPKQYANPNKVLKPTRMFVKPTTVSATGAKTTPMIFQRQQLQTTSLPGQSTLTLVESTPGNFEIVGNHGPISLDGKLIPATSVIGKVKGATVVTSSLAGINSTQTHKAIIFTQKTNPMNKPPTIINKENSTENKS